MKTIVQSLRMLAVMTILTGVLYPIAITLVAQVAFPYQANGSLETRDGIIVGSSLIGQANNDPRYFWGRPSAVNYMDDTTADTLGSSGASNAGATNATLATAIQDRAQAFREANGLADDVVIPNEMLSASASGLDPHISPTSARLQIQRVATARNLDVSAVANLVEQFIENPQIGILGEARVNVLKLNLALDQLQ
jgi:potassium-transporting ATPase KdpC subunit